MATTLAPTAAALRAAGFAVETDALGTTVDLARTAEMRAYAARIAADHGATLTDTGVDGLHLIEAAAQPAAQPAPPAEVGPTREQVQAWYASGELDDDTLPCGCAADYCTCR